MQKIPFEKMCKWCKCELTDEKIAERKKQETLVVCDKCLEIIKIKVQKWSPLLKKIL